ncbi:MAG: hypothetical protein ACE5HS_20125 [bacterium]
MFHGDLRAAFAKGLAPPGMFNYLHGKGKHKFEVGVGMAFVFTSGHFDEFGIFYSKTRLVGTSTLDYRLQLKNRGNLFKVSFTPFFGDEGLLPWGGISLGMVW